MMDAVRTDDIGERSREGVYWNSATKIAHQCYHIVVFVLLARILGPRDFGLMALATAACAFANSWTNCGMTSAIVQKDHLHEDETHAVFTLNLSLSLAMMAIMCMLAPVLAVTFHAAELSSMIPVMSVLFPLTSYYHIRMALLRRDVAFKTHSVIELLLGMAQSTSALGLALLGFGAWSLLWGLIIGMAGGIGAIGILAPWLPRLQWRFNKLRPMIRYAGFDILRSQVTYCENYLSYWIVGYWMTPVMLGFYDRTCAIARMPLERINVQVTGVLFPAFCRIRSDSARLQNAFRKSLTAQAILMAPILTGLAVVSRWAVPLALGRSWEPIVLPLQIMCGASLLRVFSTTAQCLNIATHAYARQSVAQAVSLPLYAGLCILSLPWGVVGVSLATLASAIVTFALYAKISLPLLNKGVRLLIDCLAPALAGSLIMGVVVFVLGRMVPDDAPIFKLPLLIAAGAAAYSIWTLWLPHEGVRSVREDILRDLKKVLRKLKSKAGRPSL